MKFLTNCEFFHPDPTATGYDGVYELLIESVNSINSPNGYLVCPFVYKGELFGTLNSEGDYGITKIRLAFSVSKGANGSQINNIKAYAWVTKGMPDFWYMFYDSSTLNNTRIGSIMSTDNIKVTLNSDLSGTGLDYSYRISDAVKTPTVFTLLSKIPQGWLFYGDFDINDSGEYTMLFSSEPRTTAVNGVINISLTHIYARDDTYSSVTDVSLYDVYSRTTLYVPSFFYEQIQPAHFVLYNNTAEAHRIDKTNYLKFVRYFGGVFRNEGSVTEITLEIETSIPIDFNYVYFYDLDRYYYVMDWEIINTKMVRITLAIDVLMSYKDSILKLNAFIDRNEFEYNPLISDDKTIVENGVNTIHLFETNPNLSGSSGTYVLNGYDIGIEVQ